jgi:hypothetical protein
MLNKLNNKSVDIDTHRSPLRDAMYVPLVGSSKGFNKHVIMNAGDMDLVCTPRYPYQCVKPGSFNAPCMCPLHFLASKAVSLNVRHGECECSLPSRNFLTHVHLKFTQSDCGTSVVVDLWNQSLSFKFLQPVGWVV